MVIANSPAGLAAVEALDVVLMETDVKKAVVRNPNLLRPTALPARRQAAWDAFSKLGFRTAIKEQKFFAPLWKHAYRKTKPLLRHLGLMR